LVSFVKATMHQNFNKVVPREVLIMGAQQIEDIFNTVRTNMRAWLHILGLGAKSGEDCNPF